MIELISKSAEDSQPDSLLTFKVYSPLFAGIGCKIVASKPTALKPFGPVHEKLKLSDSTDSVAINCISAAPQFPLNWKSNSRSISSITSVK